jgi:hypothetical protein
MVPGGVPMKRMMTTFGVLGALALSVPAFARDGSDQTARGYERLMGKALALRQEANRYRDGEGVKKSPAKAKQLDREADAIEKKAKNAEPSGWPPGEVSSSSREHSHHGSMHESSKTRSSSHEKRESPAADDEAEPADRE